MSDINKIDKNLAAANVQTTDETVFYNCVDEPFRVYGLIKPTPEINKFLRMPRWAAQKVSDAVNVLNDRTAGGRVKFITDSPYIEIRVKMGELYRASHFNFCGSTGFDLYAKYDDGEHFIAPFLPPYDMEGGYERSVATHFTEPHEVTIHFPLYSEVLNLEIGLKAGSVLQKTAGYKYELPVVYYGSSITQGACATRPGNCYQNIISRELNCDHINLGFSGSARGEDAMGEYIASLEMSVFVYDYDYNAPNIEHLEKTHSRMFSMIREKHPTLPIIMVSKPKPRLNDDDKIRREIIKTTCEQAKANGDKNVYFIDGSQMITLFGGDDGTVDGAHPNDLGFMCMAKVIGEKVAEVIK